MPDYGILDPNAFQRGYDFQRQNSEREQTQRALSMLGSNPNDPNALNALMRFQPQLAMKIRDDQRAQLAEQQKRELITRAAAGDATAMQQLPGIDLEAWKALDKPRQEKVEQITELSGQIALGAQNPAQWDELFSRAAQSHPELAQFVGKFNERQNVIAEAGQMKAFLDSQKITHLVVPPGGRTVPLDYQGNRLDVQQTQGGGDQAVDLTPEQAAPIIQGAQQSGTISKVDAQRVIKSLGPNGAQAFQQWMQKHNVRVQDGGQDRNAIMAEAQDAIARGADPAAVKARLAQMGIQ